MSVVHLEHPITIVKRSGWTYAFNFRNGFPPADVADALTGCSAVLDLVPLSQPSAIPITLSTDDATLAIDPSLGSVTALVGRGVNAYWLADNYDLQLRVFDPLAVGDRYVVRSHPNKSPVKVIDPGGGLTPIPGNGSNIALPLGFTQGYLANEALPGYPLIDMVLVRASSSKFESLSRPTAVVTFAIRRNAAVVGHAVMDPATCGNGPVFVGTVTFTADPYTFDAGFLDWVAPAVVDPTFTSGAVTLAGS